MAGTDIETANEGVSVVSECTGSGEGGRRGREGEGRDDEDHLDDNFCAKFWLICTLSTQPTSLWHASQLEFLASFRLLL